MLSRQTVYQGAVFDVEDMRIALPAGGGDCVTVRRQVCRHAPCVVMLVHDEARDLYLLEREYRVGSDLFAYGLPAGLMDDGEDVEQAALRELADEHMTMIVVTHEMGFARNVSNKVVFMENGVVVEEGPSKEFFANPREERTRTFLQNIEQHYE